MDWKSLRKSGNIEDRREEGGLGGGFGGGGRGGFSGMSFLPLLLSGRFGKFGFILAAGLLAYNFFGSRNVAPTRAPSSAGSQQLANDEGAQKVAAILGTTEDVWGQIFAQSGQRYQAPKLVLFRGSVRSACGMSSSASGPFYCPGDSKVYMDLSFFDELRTKFGARGDFPQAYVIAHEIGHHIQNLTGISRQVHAQRSRMSREQGNRLSVRQELQADCYAGVWAAKARGFKGFIEDGDIEEALGAAAAIGDDAIQRKMAGTVRPESFTHGTSQQRMTWFKRGYQTANIQACDTFNTNIN